MDGFEKTAKSNDSGLLFDNRIWVRTKIAAEMLDRSVGQIRNMVWRGQLKAKKYGGRLYFNRDYLKSQLENASFV